MPPRRTSADGADSTLGLSALTSATSTVDADGVALAAIQGLNEKVEARSRKLEAENAELKKALAALKQMVDMPSPGNNPETIWDQFHAANHSNPLPIVILRQLDSTEK